MQVAHPMLASLQGAGSVLRTRALDVVAHAVTSVRYKLPDARPKTFGLVRTRNVRYGQEKEHTLDVYRPEDATGLLPTVVYIHGGAFSMLSKDTHCVMGYQLAKRGYAVFNVNYRLGSKNPFPTPLLDAIRALEWVVERASEHGGDPSQLFLAGESAGGNLVTTLALLRSFSRPEEFATRFFEKQIPLAGVIATYPLLDFYGLRDLRAHPRHSYFIRQAMFDAAYGYLAKDAFSLDRSPLLASPLRLLESDEPTRTSLPPFFVSVGTRDPLISHSKRLKAALDARDVPCELEIAPGEIHGYDALIWRDAARTKWHRAHRFLEETLKSATSAAGQADDLTLAVPA
ncbi:MAG: alpha/beta hydrolase [Polyangiaceae bacterium]|nr:alpha/beta hydrolase [Polyangiaceae bacterium]